MQIFRLIIKKQHYYLLIYRKTIMFARKIPPLPAKQVTEYLVTKEVCERNSK